MTLCIAPLSTQERARLLGMLDVLAGYLGAPGDWGYGTRLGKFTQAVLLIRGDLRQTDAEAAAALLREPMLALERLPDAPRSTPIDPPSRL